MTSTHAVHSASKIDAVLAAYCAGTLAPAMQALVGGHLELSARNHGFVNALDELQGAKVMLAEATPVADRDARLAAIFEAPGPAGTSPPRHSMLPAAVQNFIGKEFETLKWRTVLPGIREYRIATEGQGEAVLYWIKAGRKIPFHTHDGSEATLVLRGKFHDAYGSYGRGDVAIADSDVDHQPIVDKDGDCICFAVTDAPLRLTGPIGRIIDRLFGHHH